MPQPHNQKSRILSSWKKPELKRRFQIFYYVNLAPTPQQRVIVKNFNNLIIFHSLYSIIINSRSDCWKAWRSLGFYFVIVIEIQSQKVVMALINQLQVRHSNEDSSCHHLSLKIYQPPNETTAACKYPHRSSTRRPELPPKLAILKSQRARKKFRWLAWRRRWNYDKLACSA